MTRISENQIARGLLADVFRNQMQVGVHSKELSSGYKVAQPGDSRYSATIAQLRDTVAQVEGFKTRASFVLGFLETQESTLGEASDALIRAQEIATQGANETLGSAERRLLADEVYALRDHLVSLSNTTYQGRYIFSGNSDGTPAYQEGTSFEVPGGDDRANDFFIYDGGSGSNSTREVKVSSDLTITVNQPGEQTFGSSIEALTRLARALDGYRTVIDEGPPRVPDVVASNAYDLPAEREAQTQDIQAALEMLSSARQEDVMPERSSLAGRMRRVQTAESLLELSENSARDVLSGLQDTDMAISASNLATAQTALQASLTVTTQMLRQSILDYI